MNAQTAKMKWVTEQLIPDFFSLLSWNKVWDKPPVSGDSYQFMILASLINAAKTMGWNISIPLLDFFDDGVGFALRNVIPHTHGALAGNSAAVCDDLPLEKRFLISILPKFTISKDNRSYSFFTEGCPYHKIMTGRNYSDRPDIIVFSGSLSYSGTKISASNTEVSFNYLFNDTMISGRLRVATTPLIPCISRNPQGLPFPAQGIVECSVNKSADIAIPQVAKYREIFSEGKQIPTIVTVTGNDLFGKLPCESFYLPYQNETKESILAECSSIGKQILSTFTLSVQ